MSDKDVPVIKSETPPQPRKRWYRRKRFWILILLAPLLVACAALGVLNLTQSRWQALLTKLDSTVVLQSAETPASHRIEVVLETMSQIPGFQDWVLLPFLQAGGYSLLTMLVDMRLELPEANSGVTLTAEEFRLLTTHRNIIGFDAVNEELTFEQLQDLSRMTWLKELSLGLSHFAERHYSDRVFSSLEKIQRLKSLKLNLEEASPAFAQWLRKQSQLESLDLSYQSISPEVMQALASLKNIRELTLFGSFPSHPSSQLLVQHLDPGKNPGGPNFTKLRITASSLPGTEAIVHQLLQNPSLTEVNLCQLDLTDTLVADIVALKSLTTLGLSRQDVKTKHLRAVTKLPKLKSLTMQFSKLEEDAVDVLNGCSNLELVDLRWADISAAVLTKLQPRQNLQIETGDGRTPAETTPNTPQDSIVEK